MSLVSWYDGLLDTKMCHLQHLNHNTSFKLSELQIVSIVHLKHQLTPFFFNQVTVMTPSSPDPETWT